MILIETNQVAAELLPVSQFRQHLRLGSGFPEDSAQDEVLEGYLRAALSAIEGRIGQAIYRRDFRWTLEAWENREAQLLPLAPVQALKGVAMLADDGTRSEAEIADFVLVEDAIAPRLRATTGLLPTPPAEGRAEVTFNAGMALFWRQVPPDLAQATLLLAAHYYEYRTDVALGKGCTPFGVTALLERYRPVRIGLRVRR